MSYSDLSQCTQAPQFVVLVFIMLIVMYMVWGILCRIFKRDCYTSSVGFMANFGWKSSAPAIAAAHNPNWISFGIVLGFFGDLVGTGAAIAFGNFLKHLSMLWTTDRLAVEIKKAWCFSQFWLSFSSQSLATALNDIILDYFWKKETLFLLYIYHWILYQAKYNHCLWNEAVDIIKIFKNI